MNIAVIGAGYIGNDVTALWTKKGHNVTITARNSDELSDLVHSAQKCVILKDDIGELDSLILANDIILITGSREFPNEFEETCRDMANAIRRVALGQTPPRRLIYASSSTVYGDHRGLWVNEKSKLKIRTDLGKAMVETERLFLSLEELGWQVCILRLAEIYGPWRELSQRLLSLQGQTLFGSGKNFSNMVHHADVTAAVDYALQQRLIGIYNVSDDDHPTHQDLYQQIAQKLNLPPIQWDQKTGSWRGGNKRISNHKIKARGFSFRYPHRELH